MRIHKYLRNKHYQRKHYRRARQYYSYLRCVGLSPYTTQEQVSQRLEDARQRRIKTVTWLARILENGGGLYCNVRKELRTTKNRQYRHQTRIELEMGKELSIYKKSVHWELC